MIALLSKEYKENIKNFIIKNFEFEGYDGAKFLNGLTPDNYENIKEIIFLTFFEEVVKYSKQRKTLKEFFNYWCEGLPSILNTDYYVNSAVNYLAELFDFNEEEREIFSKHLDERKMESIITSLLYDEIVLNKGA